MTNLLEAGPTEKQYRAFESLVQAANAKMKRDSSPDLATAPESREEDLAAEGMLILAILRDVTREVSYLDVEDLSEDMLVITRQSYEANFAFYGFRYELSPEMIETTYKAYLKGFLEQLGPANGMRKILIAGSGMGRDGIIVGRENYYVDAIDYSKGMMDSVRALFIGRDVVTIYSDIRELQKTLFLYHVNSYKGILAESMFEHLNKTDVRSLVVTDFSKMLVPGGVLLFRLKLSSSGKAYKVIDGVGERYFTSWTLAEIDVLKASMWDKYEIIEVAQPLAQHIDTVHEDGKEGVVSKPPFYTIMAKRRAN